MTLSSHSASYFSTSALYSWKVRVMYSLHEYSNSGLLATKKSHSFLEMNHTVSEITGILDNKTYKLFSCLN